MPERFAYGGQTILSHPIFVETILPFILVFTIVFAVLQKSAIFGKGKKQIDAIIALVIGLLIISFAKATGIIVQLIPFLAVSLVVILVLMLLLGSFMKGELELGTGMKAVLTIAAIIGVVSALLYITDAWQYIYDWIFIADGSTLFINIFFVIVIAGAIVAVVLGKGGNSGSD